MQVGLSTTPCKERVKRLERDGVIRSYQAILNPQFLDAALVVFVQMRLNRTSQDIFEEFTRAAYDLPEVQECYLVSGNFDYLIKARVADMAAYREFLGETLLTLPGVLDAPDTMSTVTLCAVPAASVMLIRLAHDGHHDDQSEPQRQQGPDALSHEKNLPPSGRGRMPTGYS